LACRAEEYRRSGRGCIEGVESGVGFLNRVNRDHSVKASRRRRRVGGGNVAVDVARTAQRVTDGHM
jgi:NADPH-dependent glutamate synthase beta subunit-like oxidoreductase